MRLSSSCPTLLLLVLSIVSSKAAFVLAPQTAVSDIGSFNSFYLEQFLIDQSGLTQPYVSLSTDFSTYVAATGHVELPTANTTWASEIELLPASIKFSLGGTYLIDALALWNGGQVEAQMVNDFQLYAASSSSFADETLLGTYSNDNPDLGSSPEERDAQIFAFSQIQASHVRMQILSNHGSVNFVILGEVAFSGQMVPEPSQSMLFSVGLISLLARRARRGGSSGTVK